MKIIIEKEKKGDRCTRIAKRKYDVWPSAYASGAVVKCRQGKIWKGVSEQITEEELQEIIAEELADQLDNLQEKKKPDFKKEKEQGLHGWFSRKGGKDGKGWVDCNTCRTNKETGKKTCKTCGRQEGEKRAKYPSCRPKPSDCGSTGKGSEWGKKSESIEIENSNLLEQEEDLKKQADDSIKNAEKVVSAAAKEKQAKSNLKMASSPDMKKSANYEFLAKVEAEKLAKKNLEQTKQTAQELSEQSLEEMEPFQKEMHKMHPIWKARLIGKGGQKAGAAYTQAPDMKRGKSAPPGAGGV